MMFAVSCGDEENPDAPTVTAPTGVTEVEAAEEAELTFTVTVPGGFKSATATAVGGEATVTSSPDAGATTGDVVVTFAAGLVEGAGSVTLTVTDESNQTANATAIIDISTEITISGNITANDTWETGKVYILSGRIAVVDGVTLTIEPGVVVKGEAGTGANASALLIARGGKLMAEGTATSPIIFTSVADEIQPGMIESPNLEADVDGLWGGLLILGKAPISVSTNENSFQIEGIPASDTNGLYGGTNAEDNSGVIKYVSIRHGGANIGEGNEINGLTLGGVGSGTVIENIEIVGNQDDGIEWFGGTVNVKNAIVVNAGDDAIDTDQAWAGTLDNFIVIGGANTDHALELDGPEGAAEGTHTIKNGSFKGYISAEGTGGEYGDLRSKASVNLSNLYFFHFAGSADLELDNAGVSDNWVAGKITFENLQFNVSHLTTGNTTLAAIFKDDGGRDAEFNAAAANFASIVTTPTTGATKAAFAGWSWADKAGLLADF